jgi:cellulose synthase operon protein YhjQ
MTDRNALSDQNETPEDVATLYSWANLHGAKYRDFSASRAQTREKARQRVQEAIDADLQHAREEAEAAAAAEAQRAAEEARAAESVRLAELAAHAAAQQRELAAHLAAQEAARQAAQLAAQQAAQQAAQLAAQQAAEQAAARQAEIAAQQAAQEAAQQRAWQQSRFSALSAAYPAPADAQYYPQQPPQSDYPGYPPSQSYRPAAGQPHYAPVREDSFMQPRLPWAPPDPRESTGRPAWLTQERGDIPSPPAPQAPLPQALEDTLQGSRDRLTSRWFALKSIFEGDREPVEAVPIPMPTRAPALAVFSLAGGVGKTSLVATLGRALSARGERVLLVDTAAFGLLPFFFGARDQRPGLLRTFSPPGASGDAPIQMVAIDPESLGPVSAGQEALTAEIAKYSRGASRVIIDLATASGATTRKVMRMAPLVLVPMIPDMNSVVSVSSIDAFFQHNASAGKTVLPYYVLNQFDPSLPLHLDVREVLREQLGDRLLPFALRRAPAVSEALAEGMTVMDYAPNSTVAEDFGSLAGWVKGLSAPASSSYRGVRWSER